MRATIALIIALGTAFPVSAQLLPKVLRPAVAPASVWTAPDTLAVRSRLAGLDLRLFDVTGLVDPGNAMPDRTVLFDLFDGVSVSVHFTSYELSVDHQCVLFYGTVEGSTPGRAVAAVSANLFSANLSTGDGHRYHLGSAAPGLVRVEELESRAAGLFPGVPRMELAVAYTTAARIAAGSDRAMHNLIELSVAEANWQQAINGSPDRVRLVYDQEVDLPETGSPDVDLVRFQQAREGLLPDPHGADAVSLWLDQSSRGLRMQMQGWKGSGPSASPRVIESRAAVSSGPFTEFAIPTPSSNPLGVATGPDGNLWFTENNNIGRITPAGVVTEFAIPTAPSHPWGITGGPDGNLWFTEIDGNKIGRITTAGVITEFAIPTGGSSPQGITTGPDGNLWFTEYSGGKIGRITTTGVITEFAIPRAGGPQGITTGPDGNLWFTEYADANIGRITPAGVITKFALSRNPTEITAGPDGNLWFTEGNGNKIGRITTAGVSTEFAIPTANSGPGYITSGLDGSLWFTEVFGNKIGRITPAGVITEFAIPTAFGSPGGITSGPDGNLWFTEAIGNKIGRLALDPCAGAFSLFPSNAAFGAAGGAAAVGGFSSVGGCTLSAPVSSQSWLTVSSTPIAGIYSYTVAANTSNASRSATLTANGASVTVTQLPAGCAANAIATDLTLYGTLANSSCVSQFQGTSYRADRYTFTGTAGQKLSVAMMAPFYGYLTLVAPSGTVLFNGATNNPKPGTGDAGTHLARIPADEGFITLTGTGVYQLEVTTTVAGVVGAYTLVVDSNNAGFTNERFVRRIYRDVLAREPDVFGQSYWLNYLASSLTPATVAPYFLNSAEYNQKGYYLAKLYLGLLHRDPDFATWASWHRLILRELDPTEVLAGFMASPEFTADYGGTTNAQFVTKLFQLILRRNPGTTGLAYWQPYLDNGLLTRAQVVDDFIRSAEYDSQIYYRANADLLYLVLMQRNADVDGLNYWIGYLGSLGFGRVVGFFVNSPEYQGRF